MTEMPYPGEGRLAITQDWSISLSDQLLGRRNGEDCLRLQLFPNSPRCEASSRTRSSLVDEEAANNSKFTGAYEGA